MTVRRGTWLESLMSYLASIPSQRTGLVILSPKSKVTATNHNMTAARQVGKSGDSSSYRPGLGGTQRPQSRGESGSAYEKGIGWCRWRCSEFRRMLSILGFMRFFFVNSVDARARYGR